MLVDLERSEVPWCCDVVTLEAVTILFFSFMMDVSPYGFLRFVIFIFGNISLCWVLFFFVVFIIVVIIFIITSVGFGLFVTFVFLHSSLPFIERRCLLRPWVTLVTNSLKIDVITVTIIFICFMVCTFSMLCLTYLSIYLLTY